LSEKLNQAESAVESLTDQLSAAADLETLMEQRDRQLNSLTGQIAHHQLSAEQQAIDHAELVADLTNQLSRQTSDNQMLNKRVQAADHEAAQASLAVSDREQHFQLIQNEWAAEKSQLLEQERVHKNRIADFDRVNQVKQQVQSELVQLKTVLSKQQKQFEIERANLTQAHASELNEQLRSSGSSLTSAKIELHHYQVRVSNLQKTLAELTSVKDDLRRQAVDAARKLELNEQKIAAVAATNEALSNSTARQDEQLADMQQQLRATRSNHAEEISRLQTLLKAKDEAVTALQEEQQRLLEAARTTKTKDSKSLAAKRKTTSTSKSDSTPKDLTIISGIGPVAAKKLRGLGVERIEQIAAWTADDVKNFSVQLSVGRRIKTEKWVQQAKRLSR
jgi:predicted flap endonuclease-1-like 5' DNA nuclease